MYVHLSHLYFVFWDSYSQGLNPHFSSRGLCEWESVCVCI